MSLDEGSINGGQLLTITGVNFGTDIKDIKVRFGEKVLVPLWVTETEIDILTPARDDKNEVAINIFYKNYEVVDC